MLSCLFGPAKTGSAISARCRPPSDAATPGEPSRCWECRGCRCGRSHTNRRASPLQHEVLPRETPRESRESASAADTGHLHLCKNPQIGRARLQSCRVCLSYEPALAAEGLTATSSEPKWMTSNKSHRLTRRIVIPSADLLFYLCSQVYNKWRPTRTATLPQDPTSPPALPGSSR
jgi:hypothetical protein